MTPTHHLILAFIAGALLATVASWYAKRALLRSNANLRAKLMTANKANDALRSQAERAFERFKCAKSALTAANRSLGQYRRERRVER